MVEENEAMTKVSMTSTPVGAEATSAATNKRLY